MRTQLRACAFAIAHEVLTGIRAPLLSRRFQRAVAEEPPLVKVNVGSGNVYLDGWINTDVTWRSHMYLDLTRPWPVQAGSIDRIYGDNVIEHFPLHVCRIVLRHCWDALRTGGALRLATPDVERTARAYLDDPELTAAHLDRHRRHGFPAAYPVDMLRITYAYHGHHLGYCFDWAALSAELSAAGFAEIRRYEAGQSDDPVFQGLEHRQEPSEAATGLVVEARKTGRPTVNWRDRFLADEDGSGRSSGRLPPSGSRPQRR
jgi:predicted SAM-dependent methyltransferase